MISPDLHSAAPLFSKQAVLSWATPSASNSSQHDPREKTIKLPQVLCYKCTPSIIIATRPEPIKIVCYNVIISRVRLSRVTFNILLLVPASSKILPHTQKRPTLCYITGEQLPCSESNQKITSGSYWGGRGEELLLSLFPILGKQATDNFPSIYTRAAVPGNLTARPSYNGHFHTLLSKMALCCQPHGVSTSSKCALVWWQLAFTMAGSPFMLEPFTWHRK